ncbi:hypothetical protein SSZBM1_115 [Synechococcus phage S-SZBM1]|uniref:Uncharacterized protein n=1 Tax=Synechococcus phage S-SZBM1 TaxID=2926475 RepID=A0AC61TSK8_9CAUD|nr:hypothetical protein PP650_gp161 [Synechococcus phage S-SZBM1]UNH61232.1 hypothetical protein SSZBM1_115 [Synechococcus phage S-SZBM1]
MTFTPYKNAVNAAKAAVIAGLRIDEDPKVLSELWRHYLGLVTIEQDNQHTELDDNLSPDYFGEDPFTTEDPIICGGPVGGAGLDVITFP